MTDDDIRVLRTALADGPTPGPWESLPVGHGPHYVARVNNREVVPPDACELAHEIVDARYIAAASPDRIARLLDEVERLRAENESLRADAERYRWIKSRVGGEAAMMKFAVVNSGSVKNGFAAPLLVLEARTADDAIDAAR